MKTVYTAAHETYIASQSCGVNGLVSWMWQASGFTFTGIWNAVVKNSSISAALHEDGKHTANVNGTEIP